VRLGKGGYRSLDDQHPADTFLLQAPFKQAVAVEQSQEHAQ
jgi:hypothetical protein